MKLIREFLNCDGIIVVVQGDFIARGFFDCQMKNRLISAGFFVVNALDWLFNLSVAMIKFSLIFY